VNAVGRSRAQARFRPWLPSGSRILDIGSGTAHVAEALRAEDHFPVACNITDLRFVEEPLVLADGAYLPFASERFDVSLLCTVMHHAPRESQPAMLLEGVRVLRSGGRLLILEDVYENFREPLATRIVDAVSNGELFGEPHSNRKLSEWTALLDSLGLRVIHTEEFFSWFYFARIRQALIVVEANSES
jgi:ubiquinone/menaquinone biosynthesis C-methylase UbiE